MVLHSSSNTARFTLSTLERTGLLASVRVERGRTSLCGYLGHSSPWDAGSRSCPVPSLPLGLLCPAQTQVGLLAATFVCEDRVTAYQCYGDLRFTLVR